MRLFISYARVDKPFCMQIVETLDIHEIWFDQRLYAGQQWWKEILRWLDWADGFVYLMSHESLTSEYCLKEYRIAQSTGKPIFPVLIQAEAAGEVPPRLAQLQYTDLSRGLTTDGVKMLLNAIHITERQLHKVKAVPVTTIPGADTAPIIADIVTNPVLIIGEAAEAMQEGKYDRAVYLLRQAKESGLISRYIDIDRLLAEAEAALEQQTRLREIERDYQSIAELVKRKRTRAFGFEAFKQFQREAPGYDPEKLEMLCREDSQEPMVIYSKPTAPATAPSRPFTMPMLEWCDIPAGSLIITEASSNGSKPLRTYQQSISVEAFKLAKYPVTNAQYCEFIKDPQGFANPKWWSYSPYAQAWREQNREPVDAQFKGDERPRENVTWYEAMAFCYWLSEKTGMHIVLPSKQQWRRAAQGDDGRIYPWGNEFDPALCNTRESRIRMTTIVMRYPGGVSPYGVYDLSGNVWEWCLNSAWDDFDISTDRHRAVQGGSFIGAHERAQINFSFDLAPDYHYGSIGFRLARLD